MVHSKRNERGIGLKRADDEVRLRLKRIVEEHSQAKIVRVTGIPQSTVSDYLQGRRIPAAALNLIVKEMRVNPGWLLTGEGECYLDDITPATSSLADNVMELVQAMDSVSRQRWGSATGADKLKLRELHEALERHTALKQRMEDEARPVLTELIRGMRKACDENNADEALRLGRACEQIALFCEDDLLQIEFLEAQAQAYHIDGQFEAATNCARQAFKRALSLERHPGDAFYRLAFQLTSTLVGQGKVKEAKRICRSVLALAPQGADSPHYRMLRDNYDRVRLHLGILQPVLARALANTARDASNMDLILRPLFYAGILTPQSLMANWPESLSRSMELAMLAHWHEELSVLELAQSKGIGYGKHQLDPQTPAALHVRFFLQAIKSPSEAIVEEYRETLNRVLGFATDRNHRDLYAHIHLAKLCRVLGMTDRARAEVARSQELLDAIDSSITPRLINIATHHRNTLCLLSAKTDPSVDRTMRKALRFFNRLVARGFGLFAGYRSWVGRTDQP